LRSSPQISTGILSVDGIIQLFVRIRISADISECNCYFGTQPHKYCGN
jgi:hypothetical protein